MLKIEHCSRALTAGRPTCLLSVYFPTRSGATDEFKEALDLLDATLGLYGLDNDVYILGDLNADLGTEGGPQACTPANEHGRILLRYLRRWKYLSYHLHLSPSQSTHTYESEAHESLSTINHFLLVWVHHICSPPSPSVLWVKKTLLTPQTISQSWHIWSFASAHTQHPAL